MLTAQYFAPAAGIWDRLLVCTNNGEGQDALPKLARAGASRLSVSSVAGAGHMLEPERQCMPVATGDGVCRPALWAAHNPAGSVKVLIIHGTWLASLACRRSRRNAARACHQAYPTQVG